mmetsp:Transcript_76488/g.149918  ORF Transcript_76488/g.149918 Transcript_76488/m.149918 type:complete len:105 (+) Transcript_76488:176-490(+)
MAMSSPLRSSGSKVQLHVVESVLLPTKAPSLCYSVPLTLLPTKVPLLTPPPSCFCSFQCKQGVGDRTHRGVTIRSVFLPLALSLQSFFQEPCPSRRVETGAQQR